MRNSSLHSKMVKLIGKINLTLCGLVLFYGCHRGPDIPIPAYPAPNDKTEYKCLDDEILLSDRGYSTAVEYYEDYQGEFVKCGFEQCVHGDVYIAPMYLLFDAEQPLLDNSSDVYMWLESEEGDAQIHSNVMAGGEFTRLDENGYFLALIRNYIYSKFDYDYELSFWLQISSSTLSEETELSFRIKFYDFDTGVYYESKRYQVQVTEKYNEGYRLRIDEIV